MERFVQNRINLRSYLPRLIILGIVDVCAIYLTLILGQRISILLGVGVAVFTIGVNVIFLDERLYPWRWISPAFFGMAMLVIYPIGFSVTVAFSNYSSAHSLTKEQAIDQILQIAKPSASYDAYLYRNGSGQFKLWLQDKDSAKTYIATPGEGTQEIKRDDPSFGTRNEAGVPASLSDYQLVPAGEGIRYSNSLTNITIKVTDQTQIKITKLGLGLVHSAQLLTPVYRYDAATDTMTENATGDVYKPEKGYFVMQTSEGVKRLKDGPLDARGFIALVGFDNITQVVTDPNVRAPFMNAFIWTIVFASGSVISTFALGLGFALLLNARVLPLRPVFRSLLILPYAIPFWLTANTWQGLLNPEYGPVNRVIKTIFGSPLQFTTDGTAAKIAILLVNLYLGFPYMMLITLGALQSVPSDMYEAAVIDGANDRQQFQFITLPMLLIAVGPLLVASFAYNFNNFTLIELMTGGGPRSSAGAIAGDTDILLSYTYRLAFGSSGTSDYGFAAAIGLFIFMIVGTITFFNFRFTRRFEEASR